jgi:uncharacterized protein (DUF362 family)/ferredoxin
MPSSKPKSQRSIVSAALNAVHSKESTVAAIRSVVEHLSPPLSSLIRPNATVLVKVNMGCTGVRPPEMRYTSHPTYVEAIIEVLQDCGARVIFGDDVSRDPRHMERLWSETGMLDISKRTGAKLVDFISAGGREVRGSLLYPRTHFITNLVFEVDAIVNAANCRSLSPVVMSGAVKNMFGVVLGRRKLNLHALCSLNTEGTLDIRDFSRVLVDVFQLAKPVLSFLDLTSVIEGQGIGPKVKDVGLILGSIDAVALDTVATQAIGYEELTLWTGIYGQKVGLGTNDINDIEVRGIDWPRFEKKRLLFPAPPHIGRGSIYDRATRFLNNTLFRPRPVISAEKCNGCGDCTSRCPAGAITPSNSVYTVDLGRCADCGCCVKVCDIEAVTPQHVGVGKMVRSIKQILRSPDYRSMETKTGGRS